MASSSSAVRTCASAIARSALARSTSSCRACPARLRASSFANRWRRSCRSASADRCLPRSYMFFPAIESKAAWTSSSSVAKTLPFLTRSPSLAVSSRMIPTSVVATSTERNGSVNPSTLPAKEADGHPAKRATTSVLRTDTCHVFFTTARSPYVTTIQRHRTVALTAIPCNVTLPGAQVKLQAVQPVQTLARAIQGSYRRQTVETIQVATRRTRVETRRAAAPPGN
jgi:hypothetical protein